MTLQLVKKPPINKPFGDRMKFSLLNNHTMKQKGAMFFDIKFWLEHDHGIRFASQIDFYAGFVDQDGWPITHFANGTPLSDYDVICKSPYHCAADDHKA